MLRINCLGGWLFLFGGWRSRKGDNRIQYGHNAKCVVCLVEEGYGSDLGFCTSRHVVVLRIFRRFHYSEFCQLKSK